MRMLVPLLIFILISCDNDELTPSAMSGNWSFSSTGQSPKITSSFKITGPVNHLGAENISVKIGNISQSWSAFEFTNPKDTEIEMLIIKPSEEQPDILKAQAIAFLNLKMNEQRSMITSDTVIYAYGTTVTYYFNQTLTKD